MILTTPAEIPVTMPDALTVARDGLLLAHTPLDGDPIRWSGVPMQTPEPPVIVGVGLTVTGFVLKQPLSE